MFTLKKGGDGEHLGAGNDALTPAAMDTDLEHVSSVVWVGSDLNTAGPPAVAPGTTGHGPQAGDSC